MTEHHDNFFDVMTVHPLDVSTATAEAVALKHWGIAGQARELTGERDRNFRLIARDGRQFVLKFANPVERADVVDMQIKALAHIARVDPTLTVPRVIPLPNGENEVLIPHESGAVQRVRLLTWLEGHPLGGSIRTPAQRANLGRTLARVERALAGFTHPASSHPIIWDMQHVLKLREVAHHTPFADTRAMLDRLLDEFAERVQPRLPTLRRQVLYNDINSGNTLVDPNDHSKFAGLIDFGDMTETAIVIDVGTAATAMLGPDMPPLDSVATFLAAFHRLQPLTPDEIELIPLLTATRLIMSSTLQAWHRTVQPDSEHYSHFTPEAAQRRLAYINAIHTPDAPTILKRACGLG